MASYSFEIYMQLPHVWTRILFLVIVYNIVIVVYVHTTPILRRNECHKNTHYFNISLKTNTVKNNFEVSPNCGRVWYVLNYYQEDIKDPFSQNDSHKSYRWQHTLFRPSFFPALFTQQSVRRDEFRVSGTESGRSRSLGGGRCRVADSVQFSCPFVAKRNQQPTSQPTL